MCKPKITHLPLINYGPCRFSICSYTDACAAFSLGTSWRHSLGNVLRRWADRAEGVRSLTIVANGPPQIVFGDVVDSATVGLNEASRYLNDLWRDRVFGCDDTEAAPVLPAKQVQ